MIQLDFRKSLLVGSNETGIWTVHFPRSGWKIGTVLWNSADKQYALSAPDKAVYFDTDLLGQIAGFCHAATEDVCNHS